MAAYLVGQVVLSSREITEEIKRAALKEMAKRGGRAGTKKYDKKTLSKWASKGGRSRGSKVKVYCIANQSGNQLLETLFSTRERAEVELRDDELGEKDGYFIAERHISEEEYYRLLAHEAGEDDDTDDLLLGKE